MQQANAGSAGKATHLIKVLKAWKRECQCFKVFPLQYHGDSQILDIL